MSQFVVLKRWICYGSVWKISSVIELTVNVVNIQKSLFLPSQVRTARVCRWGIKFPHAVIIRIIEICSFSPSCSENKVRDVFRDTLCVTDATDAFQDYSKLLDFLTSLTTIPFGRICFVVLVMRKGGEISWSGPWHLSCTLEVFHVHSYQDQFIQPGWAECVFFI